MSLPVRQAMPQDTKIVTEILREAARWLEQNGMPIPPSYTSRQLALERQRVFLQIPASIKISAMSFSVKGILTFVYSCVCIQGVARAGASNLLRKNKSRSASHGTALSGLRGLIVSAQALG